MLRHLGGERLVPASSGQASRLTPLCVHWLLPVIVFITCRSERPEVAQGSTVLPARLCLVAPRPAFPPPASGEGSQESGWTADVHLAKPTRSPVWMTSLRWSHTCPRGLWASPGRLALPSPAAGQHAGPRGDLPLCPHRLCTLHPHVLGLPVSGPEPDSGREMEMEMERETPVGLCLLTTRACARAGRGDGVTALSHVAPSLWPRGAGEPTLLHLNLTACPAGEGQLLSWAARRTRRSVTGVSPCPVPKAAPRPWRRSVPGGPPSLTPTPSAHSLHGNCWMRSLLAGTLAWAQGQQAVLSLLASWTTMRGGGVGVGQACPPRSPALWPQAAWVGGGPGDRVSPWELTGESPRRLSWRLRRPQD